MKTHMALCMWNHSVCKAERNINTHALEIILVESDNITDRKLKFLYVMGIS